MEELELGNGTIEKTRNKNNKKIVIIVIASVLILGLLFAIIFSSGGGRKDYLTYESYSQIRNGMTYSEVVEIFDGHHGEETVSSGFENYHLAYYTWTSSSYSYKVITVGFENGRVCAKSQVGLG